MVGAHKKSRTCSVIYELNKKKKIFKYTQKDEKQKII